MDNPEELGEKNECVEKSETEEGGLLGITMICTLILKTLHARLIKDRIRHATRM